MEPCFPQGVGVGAGAGAGAGSGSGSGVVVVGFVVAAVVLAPG